MAGDRAAGQMQASPPAGGRLATVERDVTGRDTTPMKPTKPGRERSGSMSGEMVHRPEGDIPTKLSRGEDGVWRQTTDDVTHRWDPDAGVWRGDSPGATDFQGPPPDDLAADLQARTKPFPTD